MNARVLWLGGSPCAGKSSVAEILARERGLRRYSCDREHERHALEAGRRGLATFRKLGAMGFETTFGREPDEMLHDALELCREEFPLILKDLRALPAGTPVLTEGTALLPDLVAGALAPGDRAVWLVPAEAAQRERYAGRAWAARLLNDTPDPDASFERWMRRDAATAEHVRREAGSRGLAIVESDGSLSVEETARTVAGRLGL